MGTKHWIVSRRTVISNNEGRSWRQSKERQSWEIVRGGRRIGWEAEVLSGKFGALVGPQIFETESDGRTGAKNKTALVYFAVEEWQLVVAEGKASAIGRRTGKFTTTRHGHMYRFWVLKAGRDGMQTSSWGCEGCVAIWELFQNPLCSDSISSFCRVRRVQESVFAAAARITM